MLSSPLAYGLDVGENPRRGLEHEQIVRLMNIVSAEVFEGRFSLEKGTYRIRTRKPARTFLRASPRLPNGEGGDSLHLAFIRSPDRTISSDVFEGVPFTETKLFQVRHPNASWTNIQNYVRNLRRFRFG